jgi:hypothetical protein
MNKEHKCKEFYATEEYYLKGNLVNEVLYIKTTGNSGGIENIKCVECDKEITDNYRVELC